MCLAIDQAPNKLNPSNFVNSQYSYLVTLKITILIMDKYLIFEHFENGNYIGEEDLPKMTSYICGHLISWSPNRAYFECQYNYATKAKIVCTWKQKRI